MPSENAYWIHVGERRGELLAGAKKGCRRHVSELSSQSTATMEAEQNDKVDVSESFVSQILTPGSSLHPTFLLILDLSFAVLLVVLVLLLFLTSGNVHIIALIGIELALWASVKWFVHELQNASPAGGEETKKNI
ncbi:hypothetical protein IW261DRAFT_20230 [Armillaria novae-zelandiae]|uniref:Uncharacterized protein n=1 Tax=Armillaria novae-zelandiae TaxID=153914 RepID=A0AA39PU27_9AGAR|nr:hypothetical protein IW261DRAFT_20230 [Armillaria novae-zelandiae]